MIPGPFEFLRQKRRERDLDQVKPDIVLTSSKADEPSIDAVSGLFWPSILSSMRIKLLFPQEQSSTEASTSGSTKVQLRLRQTHTYSRLSPIQETDITVFPQKTVLPILSFM